MDIPDSLSSMLAGEHGPTKQKAARLVIDLASTAGASEFVTCAHAHVSGVSPLTGGHGLRRFLADLAGDEQGVVAIPTTLNSAGCDKEKMQEMDIEVEDFLKHQFEIVHAYAELGIEATLSCTPYDRGIENQGIGSWAESNAVAFSNSYTSLVTNRESGLSALATALTGWAPKWGLHLEANRIPNIHVQVDCELSYIADWSVLGDWIGKQIQPHWKLPWGMMPHITGLPDYISFEQKKALTAAAANYGCPMLWADGVSPAPPEYQPEGSLVFTESELMGRYTDLAPTGQVDLIVIGCPQASVGEVRTTAAAVRTRMELGQKIPDQRLWVFTSGHNHDLLEQEGTLAVLEEAGAVILKDTCPEVTPYNRTRYNHLLTNSLKAEHYLTSGLNRMPTSVMRIEDCVSHAFDPTLSAGERPVLHAKAAKPLSTNKVVKEGKFESTGRSLPSQTDWSVQGKALVTDVPITYLGYVNRDTGVIEEPGHPLDGIAISDTILIYPKGSGSTVAPFILMGLIYTGMGPRAIVNRDVCPLTLPAASLLNVPYAHGFDEDPCLEINSGDDVMMTLTDGVVQLQVVNRG
ncbi:MAG: aconitase X [Candidatus Thermoplasmatota archaeon]|nr:aconitase X [Candidatus Thermoplasmatota archaeon]